MAGQNFGDRHLVDLPGPVPFGILLPGATGPAGAEQQFPQVSSGGLAGRAGAEPGPGWGAMPAPPPETGDSGTDSVSATVPLAG